MKMPTIVTEIERVEKEVVTCEEKLDRLERSLRLRDLADADRQSLKEEEKRWKKKLSGHESELGRMRKENGKTTVVSFVILGVVLLVYYLVWVR